jgi:hypothetical protein
VLLAVLLGAPSAADASTFRFGAEADTFTSIGMGAPAGALPYLRVSSEPREVSYLRFRVAELDGPVEQAYLELTALSDGGPAGIDAHEVARGDWDERTLTSADAPELGPVVGRSGSFAARGRVYVDVTRLVTGNGPVSVGLSTTGWTTRWLASRETDAPARLVVETPGYGAGVVDAAAPPAPADPSGRPMPVGDRPGWRQVLADDFTGGALDARRWGTYSGQPAGDPGGWWDPSHVVVAGGAALLRTYRDPRWSGRWVSGGMSSARALSQTYGKYEVRFRMDSGPGVFPALLLFPTGDHWPPEIDFAEDGGRETGRDHMTATLHYGSASDHRQMQATVDADFTTWHTIGVEWLPHRLTYTLDGAPWAEMTGDAVPSEPMELDLQTQAGTLGDPWTPAPGIDTPPEVDLQVDWVTAYAPVP